MATVAERVGRGPCPHCGELLTFKRSSGKLLNFKCDACCSTGYAEPGGSTHDKWAKTIKPITHEGTHPDLGLQPAKPAADPAPPKPKRTGAFDLADLT